MELQAGVSGIIFSELPTQHDQQLYLFTGNDHHMCAMFRTISLP